MMDTAADEEGYYQIILGEQLDGGRYKVYALVGKGMFSNVVRAREYDLDAEEKEKPIAEVCIKIVRSQESMSVLCLLNDPVAYLITSGIKPG
jgi:serine/threonine-protein kinase PRP4